MLNISGKKEKQANEFSAEKCKFLTSIERKLKGLHKKVN